MMVSSFFGLIFMGLCIYSSEFTSLGNQKVLVLWYSTNTRKLSEGRLCRRKPSDGQVSHRTFGNMNLERERLEGESSHFPLFSLFFVLPFDENERHIYRPNWFDLGPSYFDDKCHCSYDIWQYLSSRAHVDWHMDIQTCLQIRGRNVLSLGYFY